MEEKEIQQKNFFESISLKEEEILSFWEENKIFQKTLKEREGKEKFIFYEGPPTANGLPGLHHVLARSYKDLICRYKTMRGFYVERRAGWDTHGLPVEIKVEKEIGITSKSEIEKYGVERFNQKARESVWRYKKEWDILTKRMGYWLDLENPYITCENYYIETIFWIIKKIYNKGLLYQDYRVVPYCPRCGTPLSSHELALGYKTINDPSLYIKFEIKNPLNKKLKDLKETFQAKIYLLVWTTTPWTLPANVAIAVGKDLNYQLILKEKEIFISYNFPEENFQKIGEIKGEEIIGEQYISLYQWDKPFKKIYQVIEGDFISTEEGTGLVHIAPAFGEEDLEVGKKENLPILLNIDENGIFTGEPEILREHRGKFFKDLDSIIFDDLKNRGLLLKGDLKGTSHEYPFCWRCHSPLIYYAKKAWFIKMSALREEIIKNNDLINWEPAHIKTGRFGQWLNELKDWTISRNRYWGTPLPIWECRNCHKIEVIGSLEELKERGGNIDLLKNEKGELDLHRPYIDRIKLVCLDCQGEMVRDESVLDCWFDSGAMPYASWHWPFHQFKKEELNQEEKILIKKIPFPADLICEGIDQTRGWFYTLLAISTLLNLGPAYKNVVVVGLVLDEKGEKMSKSKGNVIDPMMLFKRYGADSVRWYLYAINSSAENKRFSEKDLLNYQRRIFNTFYNVLVFYNLYAFKGEKEIKKEKLSLLDLWVLAYLEKSKKEITHLLDNYKINEATKVLDDLIDNLSRWYLRRSRPIFQKKENQEQWENSSFVLRKVILETSLLLAPFVPFFSEMIYQEIKNKNDKISIHLKDWPSPYEEFVNNEIIEKMEKVKHYAALSLALRQENKIKLRQPLKSLILKDQSLEKEYLEILKEEVNVKEIKLDSSIESEIILDKEIDEALKEEGVLKEIKRKIQAFRQENKLQPKDKIILGIIADNYLKDLLERNLDFIKKECLIEEILFDQEISSIKKEFQIDSYLIKISLKIIE